MPVLVWIPRLLGGTVLVLRRILVRGGSGPGSGLLGRVPWRGRLRCAGRRGRDGWILRCRPGRVLAQWMLSVGGLRPGRDLALWILAIGRLRHGRVLARGILSVGGLRPGRVLAMGILAIGRLRSGSVLALRLRAVRRLRPGGILDRRAAFLPVLRIGYWLVPGPIGTGAFLFFPFNRRGVHVESSRFICGCGPSPV